MKKHLILLCSLFMATALISSCAQDAMEPEVDAAATGAETRAYGDKTPKVMMYIEVNDTNPLNTMLYRMNNEPFIDITTIFAANIRANGSEPALWLNDNVTKILVPDAGSTTTGHYKYVQPIRQDGGKVLMTILGDHQGVGAANLTEANQDKFAEILAWAVEEYQLDGIDFDDEWAEYGTRGYPYANSTSYSNMIIALAGKTNKSISVFDWGNTGTLSSTAISHLDWGCQGSLNGYGFNSSFAAGKYLPLFVNLTSPLSDTAIRSRTTQAKNADARGICFFLPMSPYRLSSFNAAAQAFGETVSHTGKTYSKDYGN